MLLGNGDNESVTDKQSIKLLEDNDIQSQYEQNRESVPVSYKDFSNQSHQNQNKHTQSQDYKDNFKDAIQQQKSEQIDREIKENNIIQESQKECDEKIDNQEQEKQARDDQSDSSQPQNNGYDDDEDLDAPILKQQNLHNRKSHLPDWLLDADKILKKFDKKLEEFTHQKDILDKGLIVFEQKQKRYQKQQKQQKEQERQLKNKFEALFEKSKKQLIQKTQFFQIPHYILFQILKFLPGPLALNICKYARISKRFSIISRTEDIWESVAWDLLGNNFIQNNKTASTIFNIRNKLKGYWRRCCEVYTIQLVQHQKVFENFIKANSPTETNLASFRGEISLMLDFFYEAILLFLYNQPHPAPQLYTEIFGFIFLNQNHNGSFSFTRLAENTSVMIRPEAIEIIQHACSFEKKVMDKIQSYINLSAYFRKFDVSRIEQISMILNLELSYLLSENSSIFISSPYLINYLKFASSEQVISDNVQSQFQISYQLNELESISNKIKNCLEVEHLCKAVIFYRSLNQFEEISGNGVLKRDGSLMFTGQSQNKTIFNISGSLNKIRIEDILRNDFLSVQKNQSFHSPNAEIFIASTQNKEVLKISPFFSVAYSDFDSNPQLGIYGCVQDSQIYLLLLI